MTIGPNGQKIGIDFGDARLALKGLPRRRLDSDWLGVDRAGRVALFAANERGPIPSAAETARVAEALEAVARTAAVLRTPADGDDAGYRGFSERVQDPIFDAPCTAEGAPTHEEPIEGYPLLIVGSRPELREIGAERQAREATARAGLALVFPAIAHALYEALHRSELCLGCRVLDDPADPRPRGPEALAAAGIFSYAHVSNERADPYRRIAAPTMPADLVDLEPVVQLLAALVRLPVLFEDEATLAPIDFATCD